MSLTPAERSAHDAVDDVTAAISCCFVGPGDTVCGGYERFVRLFRLERPGRECSCVPVKAVGLVTSLAAGPDHLLAAGGTSKGVALLDARAQEPVALLHGHRGGITHARFSPCGNYLYTAARRDDSVLCWDARALSGAAAVYSMSRGGGGDTNQRIAFDIEPGGRHLSIGGTDGLVRCFDLQTAALVCSWRAATHTVAAFAYHPAGLALAVTGSGCRLFPDPAHDDDDADETPRAEELHPAAPDNALRLWRWPK